MKDADIIAQLADIQPPPAPESGVWSTVLVIVAAISAAIVIIYIYKYRHRHSDSLRIDHNHEPGALARLDELEQAWRDGRVDDRQTAFRLAALVRLGLGTAQWPSPGREDDPPLTERLSRLRYEREPHITVDQTLFASARAWLLKGTATKC